LLFTLNILPIDPSKCLEAPAGTCTNQQVRIASIDAVVRSQYDYIFPLNTLSLAHCTSKISSPTKRNNVPLLHFCRLRYLDRLTAQVLYLHQIGHELAHLARGQRHFVISENPAFASVSEMKFQDL